MSVWYHSTEKQLFIIGQDESCFKQYSFSKRYRIGPGGEMKLLLKTDGFTQMVSAFVSRSFVVSLLLNDEEMKELNKWRANSEWGKYISSKEAIEISKEEIHELASNHQNELDYLQWKWDDWWLGQPAKKNVAGVVGAWVDQQVGVRKYSADCKSSQKDEFGRVREEFERYVLRTSMSKCLDFAGEQSTM